MLADLLEQRVIGGDAFGVRLGETGKLRDGLIELLRAVGEGPRRVENILRTQLLLVGLVKQPPRVAADLLARGLQAETLLRYHGRPDPAQA